MIKFSDLEKNFGLSSERHLELSSTNGEAVIAVESRDHAKNNGVSPKDQMSRRNIIGHGLRNFEIRTVFYFFFFFVFAFTSCKWRMVTITTFRLYRNRTKT